MYRNILVMRAIFILALLLSVASPPGLWPASADASPGKGATTAAMGAPAGALGHLFAAAAKAGKTFSSGALAALDRTSSIPHVVDFDHPIAHASLLHAIAIDCPPLSPRPPPRFAPQLTISNRQ